MDRYFTSTFPFSGDSSAPLWNFPPIDQTETTLFSDATLHTLVPFPSDFFSVSDSNILLSKIPKLEPFSPSSTPRFAANLPALRSFESPTSFNSFFTNLTSGSTNQQQQTLKSVVQDVRNNASPPSSRGSKRKRTRRIGDKYRSLKKLMPLDKRMDTASMLGEAYKYIKFLQAQVRALENMPAESGFQSENGALGSVFGAIGKLSRKQLLEVVLKSPEAQTMLYSEGSCVFSIEQLVGSRN